MIHAKMRTAAKNAEQLTRLQKWGGRILSRALQAFLNGLLLRVVAARAYLLQPVRAKTPQARAGQPRFLGSRFASPSRTANVAELQRRPRVEFL